MNDFNKITKEQTKKPGMSKGAQIGGCVAAGVGAVLMTGPLRNSGLLVEFGVFFVLCLVGMGLGSLFSLGTRREG